MANATPEQFVEGPARVPAPYGLFSVLAFREPLDRHWEAGGVTWLSIDGSESLGVVGRVQVDPADIAGLPKEFTGGSETDLGGVFTIYGQHKVTPGAWSDESARERARLRLTALEERAVEAVLWGTSGTFLNPDFSTSPVSTGASINIGNTGGMIEVVARLEAWLGSNYGSKGIIHLSRDNATRGIAQQVIEPRGLGLYTRLGTPVVAGSGYDDTAAYGSSSLLGYRSEIFENTGQPYDLLDKGSNDLYAIAERTYCIGFEGLALGKVELTNS